MLAVWTLSNLALRDASRQAMWEDADTRNTLLECTAEGEPQILRVQALRALNSLAANKANRASMQSALWQARTHCTMHTPRTPPNRAPRTPHMHRLLTTVRPLPSTGRWATAAADHRCEGEFDLVPATQASTTVAGAAADLRRQDQPSIGRAEIWRAGRSRVRGAGAG